MRMKLVAGCLLTLLSMTLSVARAQQAVEEIPALKAEVQTAAWAQRWWMPRHEEKLEAMKKQGTVDLLMVGDSITHSWENGGRDVWAKFYAGRSAFNIGFSGYRTEQVLWRFEHGEIDGISPKLAVVMIGTNNAGHRQDPPEQTAAGIKAIVEQLRQRLPETKVLLLAIFPRGKDANDRLRKLNDATNEIIADYADGKHVFYLDISSTFLDDDGTLPKSIMPDLLHPNPKGYALWAEAMEPTIKKLIGEK
ncbi:MAG: platelet-activating factor acetylhydrolase IB subunit [Thermoguttaceae bacterium]